MNLSALQGTDAAVDEKDIRKHKNDIIRLYQLLAITTRVHLPEAIKQDMGKFLNELEKNPPNFKSLGLKHANIHNVINNFSQIYM